MRYLVCEVLEEFSKANTRDDKISVLRKHDTDSLRSVLMCAMTPRIQYHVDKVPLYKPSRLPHGMTGNHVGAEIKKLYLFEKGHPRCPKGLTQKRRDQLLIQVLESLEAKEATVFINMLLKDLRVPGLDKEIVNEAFPGLIR